MSAIHQKAIELFWFGSKQRIKRHTDTDMLLLERIKKKKKLSSLSLLN